MANLANDTKAAAELAAAGCPGCSGSGVLTDDPQVLQCRSCGGIFTADRFMPLAFEQALKFVALNQAMLANAGPDGQFYFDLTVTVSGVHRLHGWADRKTKRVVQWG